MAESSDMEVQYSNVESLLNAHEPNIMLDIKREVLKAFDISLYQINKEFALNWDEQTLIQFIVTNILENNEMSQESKENFCKFIFSLDNAPGKTKWTQEGIDRMIDIIFQKNAFGRIIADPQTTSLDKIFESDEFKNIVKTVESNFNTEIITDESPISKRIDHTTKLLEAFCDLMFEPDVK